MNEMTKQEKAAYRKAYYLSHKNKSAAQGKAYRLAHKAEIAAHDKAYRLMHKSEIAAYRLSHKSKMAAYLKVYQMVHKDKLAASSKAWAKAHPEKVLDRSARRRAVKRGATIEKVSRAAVYERDAGRCHICGKKVPKKGWHLDHIIPLARGGEHSYRNVAVSCPMCNMRKHTKAGGQLRLI